MISSQGSSIFQTGLIDSTERDLSSSQPPIGRRRSLAKSCENFVRSATSGSLAAVEAASNPFTLADTCQSRDRGEIPLLAPGQTFASMHKCTSAYTTHTIRSDIPKLFARDREDISKESVYLLVVKC